MKKLLDSIKRDLWVVLLDVVAVNMSYLLALLIRFYVNSTLRPVAVDRYLPAWIDFTPWYTIICVLLFVVFRLYGGMWRYAGINDMNRIILASISTALIHVLGTVLFYTRMPITYYVIGALLQFVFVVVIRFSYRVLLVEKKRLKTRRMDRIPAVVIGSGENGRRVVKHLEENEIYKPVAIYSSSSFSSSFSSPSSASTTIGMMDGIPIKPLEALTGGEQKMDEQWTGEGEMGALFIADPLISTEERERIRALAEATNIEVLDYTGFFSNLGGRLSLTELLSTIHGPLTICESGNEKYFEDGAAALGALVGKYQVKSIDGNNMKITITQNQPINTQDALKAAYESYASTSVSLFTPASTYTPASGSIEVDMRSVGVVEAGRSGEDENGAGGCP